MAEEMALERDELAFKMICAWNNIEPGQAPATFTVFYNTVCADAWRRVAKAAENHIIEAAIATNKPAEVDLDVDWDEMQRFLEEGADEPDWNASWVIDRVRTCLQGYLATGKGGGDVRCKICEFPLADSAENGCVEGNCSYRPEQGSEEYRRIERNRAQPAAPTQIDAVDKWEPLKISNGYQYPAQSGEYIVRMIDGAELRSQYDGRFFRRKDNWDKIIPDHEIVCFVCSTQ